MPSPDLLAHARDMHSVLPVLRAYMTDVAAPRVRDPRLPGRSCATLVGVLARSTDVVGSLTRLGEASDTVAAGACARGLFEALIDVVFLTHKPGTAARMIEWEISEQHRLAKQWAAAPGDFDTSAAKAFIEEHDERVRKYRSQFPRNEHPRRWSNHGLEEDAREADALVGVDAGLLAGPLMEWTWKLLCWSTHGSTLVGQRGLDEPAKGALLATIYFQAIHSGLATANLALMHTGWMGDNVVESRWSEIVAELIAVQERLHGSEEVQYRFSTWREWARSVTRSPGKPGGESRRGRRMDPG